MAKIYDNKVRVKRLKAATSQSCSASVSRRDRSVTEGSPSQLGPRCSAQGLHPDRQESRAALSSARHSLHSSLLQLPFLPHQGKNSKIRVGPIQRILRKRRPFQSGISVLINRLFSHYSFILHQTAMLSLSRQQAPPSCSHED